MKCCESIDMNHFFEIVKWITPIILFFLGLGFNKLSEKFKENRRLKKVELYFYELIESLDSLITQEIEIIEDCISRLKDWQNNNMVLNQSSSRVIDRILEINQADLFKIFASRKTGKNEQNIKDYKQLNGVIDYLYLTLTYIMPVNKKEIEAMNKFRISWNLAHLETMKFHNELISDDKKISTDSFLDGFINTVKKFNDEYQSTENIELAVNKLVIPLKDFCKKSSGDLRATKLMTILEDSMLAYREIKQTRESHREYLVNVTSSLMDNQKTLKELLNKMRNKKNYVA